MRLNIEKDQHGKRSLVLRRGDTQLLREVASLGQTVFEQQIASFTATLQQTTFSPRMVDYVWVADRCIQLNAQQIATMPVKFNSPFANSVEPAWLSNPDPAWYPNGIADAVFAAVDDYYRNGDAFLYVTDEYATGFPSAWTVLDAASMSVNLNEQTGRKQFKIGENEIDPMRVVQISRNPRSGRLRGTSALRAYAQIMDAQLAATSAGQTQTTTLPLAVLASEKKINLTQAQEIRTQWRDGAAGRRPGEPAILPPELSLAGSKLGFTPEELQMIQSQEFNSRVLASACGVPVFLVNLVLTGGLTYQNPAMLGEFWWRTELHATTARIARALTAQMLPRGNSVYFDPAHLTQPLTEQTNVDESPAVNASPADQPNIPQLRPVTEVMSQ